MTKNQYLITPTPGFPIILISLYSIPTDFWSLVLIQMTGYLIGYKIQSGLNSAFKILVEIYVKRYTLFFLKDQIEILVRIIIRSY